MAQGTGFNVPRGPATTPLTDMSGMAAGDMAAAEGFERAAQGLGRLVDAIEPAAQQASVRIAEQEVAAGRFQERVAITGSDVAFNRAMTAGTMARLENQRDADLDALRLEHAFDPDGFRAAAQEYRTNALGAAVPGALAIEWGAGFDRRANNVFGTIASAKAELDLREAKGATEARIERLTSETIGMAQGRALGDVLGADDVQGNLLQIRLMYEGLAGNPAFGMSAEEAALKGDEVVARIKAGAVSAQATNILRTEGTDAAYAFLQQLQTGTDLPLDNDERTLAFNQARDAVQQEVGLANQRRNQQEAEQNAIEREAQRLIDEDVARLELTGEGSGLSEDQVRAAGGLRAVSRWYKARSEALEFHQLVGDLSGLGPEEAAARIAQRTSMQGLGALPMVQDEGDLSSVVSAIIQVESGGRNGLVSADPDGAGPAGGGAFGVMQVLPETARGIAAQLGLPFDANRLRTDRAYNQRIGTAYLQQLLNRYNGDTFLAVTAYHAGEGNVDGWIRSVGDPRSGQITREAWLAGVEARGNPRSAAYPRKVLAAMSAGRASAAWDAYQGQRAARDADPATTVQRDFPVRAAREAWQANPTRTPAAEGYVQANLDAQSRANIPAGRQRALPMQSLVVYAGDIEAIARRGDTDAYNAYTQRVVRTFGKHGQRVLQDVLEVRGNTAFAAQVAARATQQAATGQRPTSTQQAQANTAARSQQMTQAATGRSNANVRALSDADVLAAAGLSQ